MSKVDPRLCADFVLLSPVGIEPSKPGAGPSGQTGPVGAINLAELRARILADLDLPATQRGNIASALQTLGRALGRPLEAIPTDPVQLRPLLAGLTPTMVGVSAGHWANVRSRLGAALARLPSTIALPQRLDLDPSPAWAACLALLGTGQHAKFHLGRLARSCTVRGIDPVALDDAVLARFADDLTRRSLCAEPQRAARDTALRWNRAVAAHPGWPPQRLTVPDHRVRHALPWDAYPATLREELERWLDAMGRDVLADRDFRAWRPASLVLRQKQLALYCAAMVEAGVPIASMTGFAAIITVERAKQAMRVLYERAGATPSTHLGQIARLVTTIGRHWLELAPKEVQQLRRVANNLTPRPTGMTQNNCNRLSALTDPDTLERFLSLPATLAAQVRAAGAPTARLAQQLQTALAIDFLQMLPLRIANLAGLRLARSLIRQPNGLYRVCIPATEVKNHAAIEAMLPRSTSALLDTYLQRYRSLLGDPASDWLFPGQKVGRPKSLDGLRSQISLALARRCGLRMHPHLFRHGAAMLILDDNPSGHTQVQRVLGHKSLATTMQAYSGLETEAAHRRHDELVEQRRAQARPRGRRRG